MAYSVEARHSQTLLMPRKIEKGASDSPDLSGLLF